MLTRIFALIVLALSTASCGPYHTRAVPPAIATSPAGDLSLEEVAEGVAEHEGKEVRWGGTVLESVEGEDGTRPGYRVLARPLDPRGQPDLEGEALGAFVFTGDRAGAAGPLVGREATVAGVVAGTVEMQGARVPLIAARELHVWGPYPTYSYYPAPSPAWGWAPYHGYSPTYLHLYERHRYPYYWRYHHRYPYYGRSYLHHYYKYHYPFRYYGPYGPRSFGHFPGTRFGFGFSYGD